MPEWISRSGIFILFNRVYCFLAELSGRRVFVFESMDLLGNNADWAKKSCTFSGQLFDLGLQKYIRAIAFVFYATSSQILHKVCCAVLCW